MTDPSRPVLLADDRHDRRLVELTHPGDWKNPQPADCYNLVVLGGGTAGLVSAMGAAGLGARVALIERSWLGGDCLVTGCVPSKGLLRAARAAQEVAAAARFGVHCDGVRIDFAKAMEWMRSRRTRIAPHDSVERLTAAGVDVFFGAGHFVGPRELEVGAHRLRFHRAVIATGARAAVPPIKGLDDAEFVTNETVFSLPNLPSRLVVIGGGPIGCELAQAFRRLGSEVTVLTDERLLPRDDPQAGELLLRQFRAEGIRVITGARVLSAQRIETTLPSGAKTPGRTPSARRVRYERQGETTTIITEEILVAAGRRPNVEDLGLDAAQVSYDPRQGIQVTDHLRTTNPRIFAAGDVCSALQFTHAADAQARLVLRNALFFGRARCSRLVVPWCTYTDPEVAHVGTPTEQARANSRLQELTLKLDTVDRAVVDGATMGYGRLFHDRRGRIHSATIVAPRAGDTIAELSLAMTHGIPLKRIASTIHPYPTETELVKRLGDAYQRGRLTPSLQRLFERFFAWLRRGP